MGRPSAIFSEVQFQEPRVLGRYALYDEIASGGMATVYYGRLLGAVGFSRTVAIKRLHPHFAKDPEFSAMFLDEARLAARIQHPNVVQTLDVVAIDGEMFLVMEYVAGESLHRILSVAKREGERVPLDVASAIVCGILHGLHAAHEATDDRGEPLHIVHRDVSPQNVLVSADGLTRVLDFGVAKAAGRVHTTQDGNVKGKLGYMSPEQLNGQKVDRRTDIFATGIVLWETLTGERLFRAESDGATVVKVLDHDVEPPSRCAPGIPNALDQVTLKALERHASKRFGTAREMALALEACVPVASTTRVASWLEGIAGEILSARARALADIEERAGEGPRASAEAESPDAKTIVDPRGAPVTQVSTFSVSSTRRFPRARRIRWASYAAVAFVAASGGIVLARFGGSGRRPGAAPAANAPPVAVTPPPLADSMPPSAPSVSPAPAAPAITKPVVRARPAPASKPHPSVAKPCTTSFVDDAGIKRYRDCP